MGGLLLFVNVLQTRLPTNEVEDPPNGFGIHSLGGLVGKQVGCAHPLCSHLERRSGPSLKKLYLPDGRQLELPACCLN